MKNKCVYITDGIKNADLSLHYIRVCSAGCLFTTEKTAMLYIRYHTIHERNVE